MMPELHIRKWEPEEKAKMAEVAEQIIHILDAEFGRDIDMLAQCVSVIYKSVIEQHSIKGIESIIGGKRDRFKEVKRVTEIIRGMMASDVNLIIFRNEPEVWFQYWLGLYMQKPTYIICEECHSNLIYSQEANELVKEIKVIKEFSQENIERAIDKMNINK